jgi:integrase
MPRGRANGLRGARRPRRVLERDAPGLGGGGTTGDPPSVGGCAVRGVRLHDLRHTAATLWLSQGVHFMQASKWLVS